MLSIEKYASMYLAMTTATGNTQQEESICNTHNVSMADWNEAKNHYTAKMMDPMDMGRTALAFSAALQSGNVAAAPKKSNPKPGDFTANDFRIYISEYDIQMVEIINKESGERITLQLGFDAKDDFEKNVINGRVHICINDRNFNMYGGISKVELSSQSIKFIFDNEGRERMQCDSVTASYNINGKLYNYLKRKMQFMYKSILEIKAEATPTSYVVNNITLNDEWKSFETTSMQVKVRPNLQNIKDTGKYPTVVNVDFNSTTIGQDADEINLLNDVEAALKDTLEYDLGAVIAFEVTTNQMRRFYVYTSLSQQDFMKRINEAFRLLPKLPLGFSGGNDENWENYSNCLNDLNK